MTCLESQAGKERGSAFRQTLQVEKIQRTFKTMITSNKTGKLAIEWLKTITKHTLAVVTMSILFVGCEKKGIAEFQLESCIGGEIHYKKIKDTSYVWKRIADDARIEFAKLPIDPKYENIKEYYYWGQNSDTTLWIEFSEDSLMMFRHVHMDSVFERFYGSWFYKDKTLRYSISQSMRRLAMERIRDVQEEYQDSFYPKHNGYIIANDSCNPDFVLY